MNMHTTTPPPRTTQSANDNGPLTGGQVKALKIAIGAMGIMIIAALLAIVARVVYLSASTPASKATRTAAAVTAKAPEFAPKHVFSLPPGAEIERMSVEDNRLLVHFTTSGNPQAHLYNLSNGKLLSAITVEQQLREAR